MTEMALEEEVILQRSELPDAERISEQGGEKCPSGNNAVTFSTIPVSYLVKRGKVDIPSIFPYRNYKYLTELSEISQVPDGAQTLGEVLESERDEYGPLQDFLLKHFSAIYRAYLKYLDTEFEPFPRCVTNRMTLAQMAECFIKEYIDDVKSDLQASKSDDDREDLQNALTLLSTVYLDEPGAGDVPLSVDALSYSYTGLAARTGIPKDRVRSLLQKYSEDMFSTLEGNSVRYRLNPKMEKRLDDVNVKSIGTVPLSTFVQKVGKAGPGATLFLLEYCGMVVFDRCPKLETFVIPEGFITDVNFALLKLLKRFKDNPIPVPMPTIQQILMQVSGNEDVRGTLLSIVKTSDIFYHRQPSDGPLEYGLKWENLDKVSSQITRILYDSGKPLFLDEVMTKYRHQALEYGLNVPDISEKYMRGCPLISSSFPGGSWGLKSWIDGFEASEEVLPEISIPTRGRRKAADAFMESMEEGEDGTIQIVKKAASGRRGEKSAPDTPTMLRLIAECIHKRGGRAKLTEIKTYIHENSGTVLQVGKVKDYMDSAPDIFKAQAAKARNAYFILRRPVDGIDFQKYK